MSALSGREGKLSEMIRERIAPFADEIFTDTMGNLVALKKGNGRGEKRIMLCAHMDEVGFMVSFIEENGLVRVCTMGGTNLSACLYKKVISSKGCVGIMLPEEGAKLDGIGADKLFVDIGASSKREAEKYASVGDGFSLYPDVFKLSSQRIAGRPLDNRAGCAVLLEVAQRIDSEELASDVYFAFCSQEEVGCRGSVSASERIAPTDALCIDVTRTGDVMGSERMSCSLGKGVAVKIKDASVICHPETVELLQGLAKENKIKYQNEILTKGGTDTSSMQMTGSGSKAGALSIPTRNIHSGVECCDLRDIDGCVSLATAYVLSVAK